MREIVEVLSISRLKNLIKHSLEDNFILKNCYIGGTIANLKRHSSGHFYFSLVDDKASIDVVMWSSTAQRKGIIGDIKNGLEVTARVSVNFYEKAGRLNMICSDLVLGQKSAYQIAFEELKAELAGLGYFDENHKKEIPTLASCIGIVTSSSGAVLHDILHVASHRNRLVKFKLFAVPVQGEQAGPVIAKGIALADADPEVDLIIVGRGGGSEEDLWCFNHRQVVEAIYESTTPVISAVGHETDYTLADFVADARGATPSHATELAVYPLSYLQAELAEITEKMNECMMLAVEAKKQQVFSIFNKRLAMPAIRLVHQEKGRLQEMKNKLDLSSKLGVEQAKRNLLVYMERLQGLNPLHILSNGYAKIEVGTKPISSVQEVVMGDRIQIQLQDGIVKARVEEVKQDGNRLEALREDL